MFFIHKADIIHVTTGTENVKFQSLFSD